MRIEVGNGIVVCDRSMLEVDTSCMQWRSDLENMPKDGSAVFVFSKYGNRWFSVHWSEVKQNWVISGRAPLQVFPATAIHAYCIPTVPRFLEGKK